MAFIFFPHLKKKKKTTKIKMRNEKTCRVHVVNCSPGPSKSLACTHFLFAGTIHAFSRIALVRSASVRLGLLFFFAPSSTIVFFSVLTLFTPYSFLCHFLEFSIYIHFHFGRFLSSSYMLRIMYYFVDRLYVFNIFLSYYYDTQHSGGGMLWSEQNTPWPLTSSSMYTFHTYIMWAELLYWRHLWGYDEYFSRVCFFCLLSIRWNRSNKK